MRRRVTVFAGLVSVIGLVLLQSPAYAGHGDISVPLFTFIQADEGEVVELASMPVDAELVGSTCSWDFHAANQESVHPGNDLILSTGGTDTVVPGVEDAPDQVLDVSGTFLLGETLTVSLRMGPDEVFSAGLTVEVVCDEDVVPATAVTTAPAATATTTAPATAPTTAPTTTAPAVDAEVAGEVVTAESVAPAASVAPASAAAAPAVAVLAVTGPSSSTGPLVGLAILLLLGGVTVLSLGTRARR